MSKENCEYIENLEIGKLYDLKEKYIWYFFTGKECDYKLVHIQDNNLFFLVKKEKSIHPISDPKGINYYRLDGFYNGKLGWINVFPRMNMSDSIKIVEEQ